MYIPIGNRKICTKHSEEKARNVCVQSARARADEQTYFMVVLDPPTSKAKT